MHALRVGRVESVAPWRCCRPAPLCSLPPTCFRISPSSAPVIKVRGRRSLASSAWWLPRRDGNEAFQPVIRRRNFSNPSDAINRSPNGPAFTILCQDPQGLIEAVPAIQTLSAPLQENLSVTVLATPGFATLLQPDSPALLDVLSAQFHSARIGSHVDVVAAIVDELPAPSARPEAVTAGLRGISVFTSNRPSKTAAALSSKDSGPEHTLTFSVTLAHMSPHRHAVTLPLPNTIFETGRQSSISVLRYSVTATSPDGRISGLRCESCEHRTSHSIELGTWALPADAYTENARMRPLTSFRTVAESMGNILRRFDAPTSGHDPALLPASRELERALQGETSRAFEVWAEVAPAQQSHLDDAAFSFAAALRSGHRFYRVQSGGGGWGSRAGLLSLALPPVLPVGFAAPATASVSYGQSDDNPLASLVTDVARRGEAVRFLRVDTVGLDEEGSVDAAQMVKSDGTQLVWLGSSPLGHADNDDAVSAALPLRGALLVPGLFGALSRNPASLATQSTDESHGAASQTAEMRVSQSWLPPSSHLLLQDTEKP